MYSEWCLENNIAYRESDVIEYTCTCLYVKFNYKDDLNCQRLAWKFCLQINERYFSFEWNVVFLFYEKIKLQVSRTCRFCVKWEIEINDKLFHGVCQTFKHNSKFCNNPFFSIFYGFCINLNTVKWDLLRSVLAIILNCLATRRRRWAGDERA